MRPALVPILLADPMPWAFKAPYAWDFLRDRARFAGGYRGALANTPNWTFTRASTGYAQTAAGVLVPFASGELRRTDKGVLIEGAGTNLLTKSQEFDHVNWSKTNCTISANAIAAPDGTTTADTVSASSTGNTGQAQGFTGTAAAYTWSVYVKAGTSTFLRLATNDGTNTYQSWFNLTTGATGTVAAQHTATILALGNGWYRCSVVATMAVASCTVYTRLADADNSTTATSGTTMSFWGAQLEAAAFPSSYIPTTTASATRAADVLKITGLSIPAPHSVLVQGRPTEVAASSEIWNTETSSVSGVGGYHSTTQFVSYVREASATTAAPAAGTPAVQSLFKATYRFDTNNTEICANGTLGTVDVSNTPPTITQLNFGSGAYVIGGTGFIQIERFAIWTRALSDAELQSLTT